VILDFNSSQQTYILRVPRASADVLLREHGFNFSQPESRHDTAVLYTKDPFCAASFASYASPAAAAQLDWIGREIAASSALDSGRHLTLPPGKELIPFQRAAVDYILNRQHALDGDEPGLGKTPTSIAVANEMQAKRVIVVCPASIRSQWERRIKEWTTMPEPFCYSVTSSRYGTSLTANWTVVSYELARNPAILRGLVKQRFDLLIVDEVHFAKDIGSKRSRAIFGYHDGRVDDGVSETEVLACLMDVCERTLTLSGTPSPNRPGELYALCRALNWDSIDWLSEQRFRERYNPQSKGKTSTGKVWAHEEEGRLPELQNRLRAYIMCRHQMKDVRHQLKAAFPDPIYDLIYLEETRAVKLALEAERMLDIDPETLTGADFRILGAISTVRKQMGLAMAPQVAAYLQMLLAGGEHKLVIFTWHTEVTEYLVRELAIGSPLWTDGRNTGAKDRIVREFITNPRRDVLIGNILTLGTGTDEIQHIANHCLFAEPDWVPGNNDQCVKRLARVGQLSRVLADFFLVRGSMAEKVLATSLRKGGTLHKTLDARAEDIVYA
jgi:SWI/SNF-related matrix-associated actin-dependent regulator 1 of chromatin subfamily A